MKAALRLERMEKARSKELHIIRIHQRMCSMSERDAKALFENLSSPELLGVMKLDWMLDVCHRGREAVRVDMEADSSIHESWIEWFLDGRLNWKDLEERAQEATLFDKEAI